MRRKARVTGSTSTKSKRTRSEVTRAVLQRAHKRRHTQRSAKNHGSASSSGRPPIEPAGKPAPQLGQRCSVRGGGRGAGGRLPDAASRFTLSAVLVTCTPSEATASVPARRHSATIAAGVNCCSTRPKSSCAAAATARHASYSAPLGARPVRVVRSPLKCGTFGNTGSRAGLPASSSVPSVNHACAPSGGERVELVGHMLAVQEHRVDLAPARTRSVPRH